MTSRSASRQSGHWPSATCSLRLAGKFALVGTYTFDVGSGRYQVSPGYAAIHGLPEGTEETSRAEWRTRVHPNDLPGVEAGFEQAMAERRREYYCEYRIVRPDGEIRWIDSRNFISYDRDGAAPRLVGANIDVTQRKETEAALKEHKASLADALVAGKVMAFEWDAVTRQSRRSDNAARILGDDEGGATGRCATNSSGGSTPMIARPSSRRYASSAQQPFVCPEFPLLLSGRTPSLAGGDGERRVRRHGQALAHQGPDARYHRAQESRAGSGRAHRAARARGKGRSRWQLTRTTSTRRSCRFLRAMRPSTASLRAQPR